MILIITILSLFSLTNNISQADSTTSQPAPKVLQELLEKITQKATEETEIEIEIEIDGLLVDNTKTKIGRDFYDLFYANWEPPVNAKNYTITILEKPFRLTSTLIVVSINENVVYQAILQPRQEIVEQLSEQAAAVTFNYLKNYEEIMRQLNGEDQAGTGIF
ncbi:CsgE family curli-type amyloid fiber assembly protein [uncultured Sunxiuqinia sp.]|uniref:CsgE family curli-type amyloid fiber assembly protein n=1 Tax=uncultured Sunxiuqinia sp. TaxID=1573825 RepID=UPI0026117DD6|nr:CsgE family curli-type amyloid fiber assembly protein [uncultured Sunxiuqinia sp.]